jgi:transcription antitermination factor NusG
MDVGNARWYALVVRSRSEELIASHLDRAGYETLCPSREEIRHLSDRTVKTRRALFPGYLFCRFSSRDRLRVLNTPGVVSIVSRGGRPIPVCDHEIESLTILMNASCELQETTYVSVGEEVQIVGGALQGVRGIVTAARKSSLIVSITTLGRSIAVQLDKEVVQAA